MRVFTVATTILLLLGVSGYLVGVMVYSIRDEKRRGNLSKTWKYFALSIVLSILFFTSWIGQGLSQWQVYVQEERTHGESPQMTEFIERFGQSTFENWQSEFLQLFAFVVLSAVLVHRGSAESKDSDEEMQAALARIEKKIGSR